MSRIVKKSPLLNLSNYQTFITDTDANSLYFKLSEVPEQLTAGKNGFLIEGTEYLKPSTEIKIEALDVTGTPIYTQPGQGIPEYYEGLSKLIGVYVYQSTPIGVGKLTILGELQNYIDDSGVVRPVPPEWRGIYNIKWERSIKVNRNLPNTTRVRFLKRPTIAINETGESFYSIAVQNSTQTTGTVRGYAISPPVGTPLSSYAGGTRYIIQNQTTDFTDGASAITIPNTNIQNASVIEYVNQRTLMIQVPYTGSDGTVQNLASTSYTLSYQYASSTVESSVFGSFATFEIFNLATFVGDAERVKVYAKSRASSADYYLLQDSHIDSSNLLSVVVSGSYINAGMFTGSYGNGNTYSNYWTTQSAANISLDTGSLYKSVKFKNNGIRSNLGSNTSLQAGSEYTLEFYTLYSASASNPADTLSVFATSTLRSSSLTPNYYLTQSIATLTGADLYRNPIKLSYNFIPDSTDNWSINFVSTNPSSDTFWQVGSVILEGSNELGYSPDEFTFTVPISRQLEIETFDFKFEYYDINNNYVPIIDTATQTFVSGNLTLLGKNLAVDADKYFFTFDQNSSPVPPTQTISINANKTNLAGNLLITSQAYDSGGIYLPPASFLGTPYPGKLSVASETLYILSSSLGIASFTGSLHGSPPGPSNVIVDRILYTFTETNSTQPQTRRLSVSRVLTNAGTGSIGAAGKDAKTVNLTSNIYAIPYNSDGIETGTNNIWLTASQQNHVGTVYYDFLKNDASKQNTTSQYFFVSQSEKPNTGSRDSWKVNTREGSSGATIVAYDTIDIFGLKDGVNGYTVFFTNAATSFPADENGNVASTALSAGITDTIFIRGTSSFTYDQVSPYDTNSYRTGSVTASANITYASSIVNSQLRITPNAISTVSGTVLTGSLIVPLIDNNTSLAFNLTYNYSVTKTGKSGSNALSVIIDPPSQTITYKTNQSTYGTVTKFNVRVLETGSALFYTASAANLNTGSFTILLPAGNGTNISANNNISGSITPPQPATTSGTTSSFAVVYMDSKGNLSSAVSASHTVNVVSDGLSGSNAVSVVLSPQNQFVSKSNAGTYSSPVTFSIQLFETGSALLYTGSSATLQNSYFTVWMSNGNATLVPATASLSASIIPASITTDSGSTVSFAVQYRDTRGTLSSFISSSHIVSVVKDGASGSNGTSGTDGGNAVTFRLTPEVQTISASLDTNTYSSPVTCSIQVYETGSALRYTGSNNTLQNGYFTVWLSSGNGNGTLVPATASLSASLIPKTPTTPTGSVSNFAIQYRDSKGTLSQYISASHIVNIVYNGVTGPGIVVTGPWQSGYVYQYSTTGSSGRRDAVLETGSQFYYATLQQHTSTGANKPTGTTVDNAYWQYLGSQSLFVAAQIAIFKDSYIQNTLNVGTNNNGTVSSANITINGGSQYPYISIGQSSATGSQGYAKGSGIFIGAITGSLGQPLYAASFETASGTFLKWDGTQLLISGNISASVGNIGGVTISSDKLYTGTGTYANANTPFYIASSSTNIFSLADKLTWDGSILSVKGSITVTGGNVPTTSSVTSDINAATASLSSSLSPSISQSVALVDQLADGTYSGGTFINGQSVVSPFIGGTNGYFSNTFLVGSSSGITLDGTHRKIYIGAGTYANANTPFYVASGSTNILSLADRLTWDGAALFISGAVSASAGSIGGWGITSSSLSATSGIGSIVLETVGTPSLSIYDSTGSLRVEVSTNSSLTNLPVTAIVASPATVTTQANSPASGFGPTAGIKQLWSPGNTAAAKLATVLNPLSSSFTTTAAQSGSYIVSVTFTGGQTVGIFNGAINNALSSSISHFELYAGAYIRSGSSTGTTLATLLYSSSFISQDQTQIGLTNNINITAPVSGSTQSATLYLSASTSYHIVPFATSGSGNIFWNNVGTATLTATSSMLTPKISAISIYQDIGKTEVIAGGMQIINTTAAYLRASRTTTDSYYTPWLTSNGFWAHYGSFLNSSDIKIKRNITSIDFDLEKLNDIDGYSYDKIIDFDGDGNGDVFIPTYGVLAQEMENIIPNAVNMIDETGIKVIEYDAVTGLLMNIVKKLYSRIKTLEAVISGSGLFPSGSM